MAELIRYELASGTVLIEAADDETGAGIARASRAGEVMSATSRSLGTALAQVRDAADEALQQFRGMSARPDEVCIEFGVKLTAEAGAVIAKTGVDGHFKVHLAWRGSERGGPEPGADQDFD